MSQIERFADDFVIVRGFLGANEQSALLSAIKTEILARCAAR